MNFLPLLLCGCLNLFLCNLYAQGFQKEYAITADSGVSYVYGYNAFTSLSNNGFAILNVVQSPSLILQVVKLNAQGGLVAESHITLPAMNMTSYLPTIIEGEQGSVYCAVGLSSNIERHVLVYKLDNNLNVLWSRKVVSSPFYQLVQMAKCGSKVYTVNRHIKRYPGVILSDGNEYREEGFLLTGFSENGTTALCKTYLSDSISINGFTGIFSNNASNLIITAPAGLKYVGNYHGPTFFTINEVDTNGVLLHSRTVKGIHPYYIQQQSNGNYLISGYKVNSTGPCIGLFDSNFNPIWIKEILIENNSWGGMAYVKNNEVYIYTKLTSGYNLSPAFMKLDMSGNPIESFIINDTLSQHYSAKLTNDGKHALVGSYSSYIEAPIIKIRVVDSPSGAGVCNAMQLCLPQVQDITVSLGTYNYSIADYDSVFALTLNTQHTLPVMHDYCNPVASLNAFFTLTDDSICIGESIGFTAAPNTEQGLHTWIVNGPAVDTLIERNVSNYTLTFPGTYTIRHIHTIAYCSDTLQRTLVVEGEVVDSVINTCDTIFKSDINVTCNIMWPDGSTGNYYVPPASGRTQIQVACGACLFNDTITINVVPPVVLSIDTAYTCNGQWLTLNFAKPGITNLIWEDGGVGVQRLFTQAGIYPVRVIGAGCETMDTLVLLEALPDASFILPKDSFCINEGFDLFSLTHVADSASFWMVTGPGYGESFPVKNVIGLQLPYPGVYNIFHRDIIESCQDTVVKQVVIKGAKVPASLTICDTVYASDISATCNVEWYDGSSAPYYISNANESSITVIVSCDGCGELFTIPLNKLPYPALPEQTLELCGGRSIIYTISSSIAQTAVWNEDDQSLSYTIDSAGTYYVVMDNGACKAADSLVVTTVDCDGCVLYIPNAFTPNGDGNNDVFTTATNCPFVIQYNVQMYNRTGEKVFESNDLYKGWDGTYKNADLPAGVYVYVLQIVTSTSKGFETKNYRGSFTLIR